MTGCISDLLCGGAAGSWFVAPGRYGFHVARDTARPGWRRRPAVDGGTTRNAGDDSSPGRRSCPSSARHGGVSPGTAAFHPARRRFTRHGDGRRPSSAGREQIQDQRYDGEHHESRQQAQRRRQHCEDSEPARRNRQGLGPSPALFPGSRPEQANRPQAASVGQLQGGEQGSPRPDGGIGRTIGAGSGPGPGEGADHRIDRGARRGRGRHRPDRRRPAGSATRAGSHPAALHRPRPRLRPDRSPPAPEPAPTAAGRHRPPPGPTPAG